MHYFEIAQRNLQEIAQRNLQIAQLHKSRTTLLTASKHVESIDPDLEN